MIRLGIPRDRLRFDRNELSGSFGDIGTDFPLIVGMILACNLDVTSTLVMFGLMQITMGAFYGLPMPVEPLKAMAVIMIAGKLNGNLLYGGGLAIGITMLFLTLTGLLQWLAKVIPKSVVRGIQLGLGLSLASLALKQYVLSDAVAGYILAAISFVIAMAFLGNRKYPAAVFIIVLGFAYASLFKINFTAVSQGIGLTLPTLHTPTMTDMLEGFLLLALPQIPLSISNSVIATHLTLADFFPERRVSIRKIGLLFVYESCTSLLQRCSELPRCRRFGGTLYFWSKDGGVSGSLWHSLSCSRAFLQP